MRQRFEDTDLATFRRLMVESLTLPDPLGSGISGTSETTKALHFLDCVEVSHVYHVNNFLEADCPKEHIEEESQRYITTACMLNRLRTAIHDSDEIIIDLLVALEEQDITNTTPAKPQRIPHPSYPSPTELKRYETFSALGPILALYFQESIVPTSS